MFRLFSFSGRTRPRPYVLSSLAVFFSQHLITILVLAAEGVSLGAATKDWQFYVMPLQTLAKHSGASALTLLLALSGLLIACWALAALAFRRAADAEASGWIAACAIAPVVQIATIGLLSAMPSRAVAGDAAAVNGRGPMGWATAAQGLCLGVAVTLFAVATGALLFGSYGFGIFVASPFTIGATTGYFANHKADLGTSRTAKLAAGAILLGGIALVFAALEGIICILMAAPLAIVAALVGGMLGPRDCHLLTRTCPTGVVRCCPVALDLRLGEHSSDNRSVRHVCSDPNWRTASCRMEGPREHGLVGGAGRPAISLGAGLSRARRADWRRDRQHSAWRVLNGCGARTRHGVDPKPQAGLHLTE